MADIVLFGGHARTLLASSFALAFGRQGGLESVDVMREWAISPAFWALAQMWIPHIFTQNVLSSSTGGLLMFVIIKHFVLTLGGLTRVLDSLLRE